MIRSSCIFCAVVAGEAPASLVYQDADAVAFLDLYPVHPGHTLVVPRRHVPDLMSCPPQLAGRLMQISARLAPAIVKATGAAGFNVWTANGRAAGQEILHLHFHILPRHEGDAFGLRFPKGYPREAGRQELDEMAARIQQALLPGAEA